MLMLIDDQVSSRAAKDMLEEVVFEGAVPSDLAKNRGLLQNNSAEFLDGIVKEVIDANPGRGGARRQT